MSKLAILNTARRPELRERLVKVIADIDSGVQIDQWFLATRGPHPRDKNDDKWRWFDSGLTAEQLLWVLESCKAELMRMVKE